MEKVKGMIKNPACDKYFIFHWIFSIGRNPALRNFYHGIYDTVNRVSYKSSYYIIVLLSLVLVVAGIIKHVSEMIFWRTHTGNN